MLSPVSEYAQSCRSMCSSSRKYLDYFERKPYMYVCKFSGLCMPNSNNIKAGFVMILSLGVLGSIGLETICFAGLWNYQILLLVQPRFTCTKIDIFLISQRKHIL